MVDRVRPGREDRLGGGLLEEIARIIGEAAALRLSVTFGGQDLYIPGNPPADSEIVAAIGEHAAELLARRLGGTFMEVPIGPGKRERIVDLRLRKGLSVSQVAQIVGCTERHVYYVQREYKESGGQLARDAVDHLQGDLFGAPSSEGSHPPDSSPEHDEP